MKLILIQSPSNPLSRGETPFTFEINGKTTVGKIFHPKYTSQEWP